MSVVVILAGAVLVATVAVTALAGRQLLRAVADLRSARAATLADLTPLREELESELAVTSLELADLRTGVERLQAARRSRHHPLQGA
jgi:hypothetical protein